MRTARVDSVRNGIVERKGHVVTIIGIDSHKDLLAAAHYRLNRGGNRQLNKAIHIAAITQIARPDTEGRRYFEKRLNDGKTKREAIRALKRRISDRVWTALTTPKQAPS